MTQQNAARLKIEQRSRLAEDKLPNSCEAERSILGAIVLDNSCLSIAEERLRPEDFYLLRHKVIFEAMLALDAGSSPIDPVTLLDALERNGKIEMAGGAEYLSVLADGMPRSKNIGSYIQSVARNSKLRQILYASHDAYEAACSPGADPDDICAQAARAFDVSERESGVTPRAVEPERGEKGRPEPISIDAFYGAVGDFVRLLEPESEADPAALYLQALAVIGNIIGREAYCQVRDTRHFPNLYVGNVGPTAGARKGLGGDSVTSLGRIVDEEWFNNCVISGTASGEYLISRVKDTDPPSFPQRLTVFEDELAFLLSSAKRESSTISSVLRAAWDGKHKLQVGAKHAGAIATDAHISLIGHITKEELLALLTDTMVKGGLVNRFLWVYSQRSKLLPEGGKRLDFGSIGKRIKDAVANAKSAGLVERNREARELWDSLYREIESTPRNGMFGKATCRASAQMLRLSLLFALLDSERVIRVPHIEAARAAWRYCEESAKFIFDDFTGNEDAEKILVALRRGPMTRTDISRLFHHHKAPTQIAAALNALELARKIRREARQTKGREAEVWIAV